MDTTQTQNGAATALSAALTGAVQAVAADPKTQVPSSSIRAAIDQITGTTGTYEVFGAGIMTDGKFFAGNEEARTSGAHGYLVAVDIQLDLTGEFAQFRAIPVNKANLSLAADGFGAHVLAGSLNKGDQITFLAKGNSYDVKGNGIGAISGLLKSTITRTLNTGTNVVKNLFVSDPGVQKAMAGRANRALSAGVGSKLVEFGKTLIGL